MTGTVRAEGEVENSTEVKSVELKPKAPIASKNEEELKTGRKMKNKTAETKTAPEEKASSQDVKKLNEPQKVKSGLGFSNRLKYGTHCVLAITERSITRMMSAYQSIFVLDKKMDFTFWKDQGFNEFSKGNHAKAINLFHTCLEKGADSDIEVLFYMGLSCVNTEQYDKGLQYLKKAENHDCNDLDIISEIGHCLIKLEKFQDATDYFKKAVLLNPDEVSYSYMLGTAYEKNGQFDQAIEMYRKSIDIDPRDPLYYHALGFVFETIEKHNDAIACFKKAMELEKER